MSAPIITPPRDALSPLWNEHARRIDSNPETIKRFKEDPLGFVRWAWRWGLPGPLERYQGPDTWQEEFLAELGEEIRSRHFNGRDPVKPIKMTRSAGKGVGKSVLVGMLTTYILECWPFCQGTVTANTFTQLESKTWATIQHWFKSSRANSDFMVGASGIRHRVHGKSWACTPQTCREENNEAFAGQHAANSIQFYIFDESSGVPEKIWEVAESSLVDGMPCFFAFGNPTRSSGKFFRINFGNERDRWKNKAIDARDCQIPNKETLLEEVEFYGKDSDYVRVYIKGEPPEASDMQYIPSNVVRAAQERTFEVLSDEPLIAGVDLARGGGDNAVIRFRCGDDARSRDPIKIPGALVRNSMLMVEKLVDLSTQEFKGKRVHTWFLDGTGIGGPMIDRIHQIGHKNFIEIQFGGVCPDPTHFANMRSYMWGKMRESLMGRLAIDKDLRLDTDLTNQGLGMRDRSGRILLESKESMKKRGLASPDDGDALALTFAQPVKIEAPPPPKRQEQNIFGHNTSQEQGWMDS
jgi:hypothetical protein